MIVQSYLCYEGRCEEALQFYQQALDAEVTALMRFRDSPEPCSPDMVSPGMEDKVMHAELRIGETTLMASDGRCQGPASFSGIALALSVPDDACAERRFAALAEGGEVQMPLTKTFFSSKFGMVADRFGVTWMLVVTPPGA